MSRVKESRFWFTNRRNIQAAGHPAVSWNYPAAFSATTDWPFKPSFPFHFPTLTSPLLNGATTDNTPALLVLYTGVGLWIASCPITE